MCASSLFFSALYGLSPVQILRLWAFVTHFLGLRHSNSIILIQIVPAWTKTPRFWGTFVLSLAWSEAQME